ncbi:WAT1-related protein At3g02690, chloroplastic [Carica papaya]|uniref:WAT1-related protein At3g02690, chloroplastic n=1 Tax=Carica papaya TaxID=3649 RepID=UPI000B8CC6C5|nr:WAT1-related protein At3g02690, chloroplastic [Carica papaya]
MGWQCSASASSSSSFFLNHYPHHYLTTNTRRSSFLLHPQPWMRHRASPVNPTLLSSKPLPCINGISSSSSFFGLLTASPATFRNRHLLRCSMKNMETQQSPPPVTIDCVGTGLDVECVASETDPLLPSQESEETKGIQSVIWEWIVLVSPFFFWGTAMVAMKEVLPKAGPFFVAAFRLIPAGMILVAFAAYKGRRLPSGFNAWISIAVFALVDAACFQGFLAEGLQRTSAGLGSVIIDSQPITVAILAALLFGESIGLVGAAGLLLGVIGLLLLEVPALALDESNFSLWGSGEWWMFLAAQSMAVGTVMVRWVSKYSDPVMATGWHMVIGGLPLVALSVLNHEAVFGGVLQELTASDILALLYTSIFGSAVSYGVFFYSATKGSLTRLSSLTFLTPMFASIFGFLYLGETFSPLQLVGATVTVIAIYMVNFRGNDE